MLLYSIFEIEVESVNYEDMKVTKAFIVSFQVFGYH